MKKEQIFSEVSYFMNFADVVAVAMSGGVDSAVAANLLKKKYSRIFGVSHYIWPDSVCCDAAALDRASDVCRNLGIPYKVLDFSNLFTSLVVDDFVAAYSAGTTPNPCVRCNERIRFSRFYEEVVKLCREEGLCADEEMPRFATGHYVRMEQTADGLLLKRALDRSKDQSYMLYRLSSRLLPAFEFPLGGMRKSEVVELARGFGFPVSETSESQDVCFINGPYTDFIASRLGPDATPPRGVIEDTSGRVLGRHRGYIHYTVGQRKGLGLNDGPWYVIGTDPERNRVIVGREAELPKDSCIVGDLVWHIPEPDNELQCSVMLRYNSPEVPCAVKKCTEGQCEVVFEKAAVATPGQSAVFYRNDCVIGGGIIQKRTA